MSGSRRMSEIVKKLEFNIQIILLSLFIFFYIIFIIPGINITVPTHADIYSYSTHFDGDLLPFTSLYLAPRPILFLALKLGGSLPFKLMMWVFAIVGVLSFFSPLVAYAKIVKKNLSISVLVLFTLLNLSYPAIFIGLIHDIGSRLAFIFAVVSVYYYVAYLRQIDYYYLFFTFIYGLLSFLSKETFGPCLLLLMVYIGYLTNSKIKQIVVGVSAVLLGLILSILHSRFLGSPFTSGESSYTVDFNILNVLIRGLHYLKFAVSPQILLGLLVIGIVLICKHDWKGLVLFIVGFFIAWSSLLPNAMLSQHGGVNYEMILVPLLSTMVVIYLDNLSLFDSYKRIMAFSMVALAISGVVWGEFHLKRHYWWEMSVARFNQNIIHSLEVYKEEVQTSNNVFVLGLQQSHIAHPWTPFIDSKYLQDNFDFLTTSFTIIAPAIVNKSNDVVSFLPNWENANKNNVDLIMVFDAEGNVWRIIRRKEQIIKFLEIKNLDMTKLYAQQYWTTNIDLQL